MSKPSAAKNARRAKRKEAGKSKVSADEWKVRYRGIVAYSDLKKAELDRLKSLARRRTPASSRKQP